MLRRTWALLAGLVLFLPGVGRAADAPGGTWKLSLPLEARAAPMWLIQIDQKGTAWTGKVVASAEVVAATKLAGLVVGKDSVRFMLMQGARIFNFEGIVKAGAPVRGTLRSGETVRPAQLEPTTLTSLDNYELY